MRNIILLLLALGTLFASCDKKTPDADRVLVAKVLDSFLYLDQMGDFIPANAPIEDSIEMLNEYVRYWIIDELMYEKAKQNISDLDEIDRLVEEYRRTLILEEYKHKLVEERYSRKENEEELEEYYETYKIHLLLKEGIIQGILLVVPKDAPDIKNLTNWIQKADRESIENIEKYSLRNAISYDYFVENWIPLSEVLRKTPFKQTEVEESMGKKTVFTAFDDSHQYFLRVTSARSSGDMQPYELVRDKIVNILATKQKSELISSIKNKMYKEAQEKGLIKVY